MQKFKSLKVSQDGKPFIPGGPDFSISHSGDMVVLAVNQSGAAGIDVEQIRAVNIDDFSRYVPDVASLNEQYDADQINNLFLIAGLKRKPF